MTDELNLWHTHPYFKEFEKIVSCKTDDYEEVLKGLEDKLNGTGRKKENKDA